MGILLTFMFLWNMLGALVLIPALSHFLLNSEVCSDSPEVAHGNESLSSREQSKNKNKNAQALTAH
ncbi:hypothetical protein D3C81_2240530 [compost metagenome]